jgi:hypothetical protein
MRPTRRKMSVAPEAWLPDSWIIEELRRERERQREERPCLELPLPLPYEERAPVPEENSPPERGICIIDL